MTINSKPLCELEAITHSFDASWVILKQIKSLRDAIEDDYFFEMFIDDLPMWGYIGEVNCSPYSTVN
jgi:hypothetical protein